MKIFLLLVCALLLFVLDTSAVAEAGMPGGWSPTSITSKRVTDAASFAVHTKYPKHQVFFQVIEAFQQVVRGVNYKLKVAIYGKDLDCRIDNYIVWDDLGRYELTSAETDMSAPCPNMRKG